MRCSRWETNVAVVTLARPTLRGVRKNPRCEAPPLLFPRLRSPRRSRACLHIPAPSARCRSVCSLSPRCCLFHIAAGWRATCARPGSTDHPCLLFDQRGEINRVGQTGLPQRSRVPIRERPLHGSGSSGEMQLRDSAWLFRPRACRERWRSCLPGRSARNRPCPNPFPGPSGIAAVAAAAEVAETRCSVAVAEWAMRRVLRKRLHRWIAISVMRASCGVPLFFCYPHGSKRRNVCPCDVAGRECQ